MPRLKQVVAMTLPETVPPVPQQTLKPSVFSTCKDAFAVYTEYQAQQNVIAMTAEIARLKDELALFGSAVGCVRDKCSNCGGAVDECECKAWTCRCYFCWLSRRCYRRTQENFSPNAADGQENLRLIDDSADDAKHGVELAKSRVTMGEEEEDIVASLLLPFY